MHPLDWLAASQLNMLFPALWLIPRAVVQAAGPWVEDLTLDDDMEYFTRVVLHSQRVLFCEGARAYYRSGIIGSLSGRKNPQAWHSRYRVTGLCENHILKAEDSERMRRMLAGIWQRYALAAFPYDAELAEIRTEAFVRS